MKWRRLLKVESVALHKRFDHFPNIFLKKEMINLTNYIVGVAYGRGRASGCRDCYKLREMQYEQAQTPRLDSVRTFYSILCCDSCFVNTMVAFTREAT